jgi:hypothetical protein
MKTSFTLSVVEVFKNEIKSNLMEEVEALFENQLLNSEDVIAGIVDRSLDKIEILNTDDVEKIIQDAYSSVTTQDDMAAIKEDIDTWRAEDQEKIDDLRSEYDDRVAGLEDEVSDLKSELSEVKDMLDRLLNPEAPRPATLTKSS